MKARRGRWATLFVGAVVVVAAGIAAGAGAPTAPAAKPAVATVGSHRILREEFERRSLLAIAEFSQRNGNRELPPEIRDLIRRQVLESLIRLQLLSFEAARTGITAAPSDAEEQLKKDPFFNPNGKFDQTRYLSIRTQQPQQYAAALAAISQQLAARKLNDQLEARFRPADDAVRSEAARSLTHATIDHLSLRRGEFAGIFPEPRESQVLAFYANHRAEFQRPDRASLTIAFVNTPGLSDSARRVPATLAEWTARMRVVGDSVLKVVHGGTSFETAAAFLDPRPGTVVTSDNFPGYWRGTPAQAARLFQTPPGKLLDEPIAAADGYLLVRVDEVTPAHVAPLSEVAREIRGRLRQDARVHHDEYEERALYASLKDSLVGPGVRIRYAASDTARIQLPPPSAADLDRFYRAHLADYSSFDSKSGSITVRPFDDVKAEIALRWAHDERTTQARQLADQLYTAWSHGKRDAALETRLGLREPPATPTGADIDTGMVGRALGDTLWSRGTPSGAGLVPYARGWIAWQAFGTVDQVTPSFDQARDALKKAIDARRAANDESGGRALFEADPMRFNQGNILHFTRFSVRPTPILGVRLTHAEVEKFHREHIDRYSAPEEVRVRHILVSPANATPDADRAALAKARDLIRQLQAGADFIQLARQYSDDPATRDKGGDLGSFGHGVMLEAFERAAFAMQPGELLAEPVKTEVGYHIIRCEEHLPAVILPLALAYSNASADAAQMKADTIAVRRADSLARVLRTPAQAAAAAAKLGYDVEHFQHRVGEEIPRTEARPFFDAIDKTKPGTLLRQAFPIKGQGAWIAWVDSLSPPRAPSWEDARAQAIAEYQRGAGQRALDAKKAELDSLLAGGWTLDSLAALWGGLERVRDLPAGRPLPTMGGASQLDSLVFGGTHPPVLAPGAQSGWLALQNGYSRIRLIDRSAPPADQLATRIQNLRAVQIEKRMRDYFGDLEGRYPVRILDTKLRETAVPAPSTASEGP